MLGGLKMRSIKKSLSSSTGMKFVISCGYFNDVDEQTHATDLIINLNKVKTSKSFENQPEIVSAA